MATRARLPLVWGSFYLLGGWSLRAQVDPAHGMVSSSPQVPGLSSGVGVSWLGYVVTILILGAAAVTLMARGGFFNLPRLGTKGPRKLHIEETRPVGSRQYLLVAEYEGRRMLLGVSPARIDYLSALEGDSSGGPGFSEVLSAQVQTKGGNDPQQGA